MLTVGIFYGSYSTQRVHHTDTERKTMTANEDQEVRVNDDAVVG